jgi:dienelactone hydrolase
MKKLISLILTSISVMFIYSQTCTPITGSCTGNNLAICESSKYPFKSWPVGDYSNNSSVPLDPLASCVTLKPNCSVNTYESSDYTFNVYTPNVSGVSCRPFVMFIHGGGFNSGDKVDFDDLCKALAQRGIAAATINYKLTQWPCVDCIELPCSLASPYNLVGKVDVNKQAGYKAIKAAKAALRYFAFNAAIYNLDRNNFYVGGWSAGAAAALSIAYMTPTEADISWLHTSNLGGINNASNSPFTCPITYSLRGVIAQSGWVENLSDIDGSDNIATMLFHNENDNTAPYTSGPGQTNSCAPMTIYGSKNIYDHLSNFLSNSDVTFKTRVELYSGTDGSNATHSINFFNTSYRASRIACFIKEISSSTLFPAEKANHYVYDKTSLITTPTSGSDPLAACPCPVLASAKEISQSNLELFPNPASNELTISIDAPIVSVNVLDIMDADLLSVKANSSETNRMSLDISLLKAGQYSIVVKTKDGSVHRKYFVKE